MPDLLLELRSEEIPARMQRKAAGDLRKLVTDGLVEAGLTYEAAREYWTPRRLTLDIRNLTARSKDASEERKGPSTKAPEQAIQGFLRAAGLASIDEAHIHSDPKKGEFYVAHIVKPGRTAEAIIAELLPTVIRGFPWPKAMRWGASSGPKGLRYGTGEGQGGDTLRWVRPLQSIVCTFGPETEEPVVVDFEVGGIRSGNLTFGHRFHSPGAITVRRFEDYAAKLTAAKVIIDADRRKEIILADAKNLAFANGLDLVEDEALLEEVAGLVEWPVVLMGEFEEDFLAIPAEVIRLTIRANQKCFVCSSTSPSRGGRAEGAGGGTNSLGVSTPLTLPHKGEGDNQPALSNRFVLTANIDARDGGAEIAHGNGKVVRSRLSDALYFWKTDQNDLPDLDRLEASAQKFALDLKKPLDQRMARLDHLNITFHAKLGTQGERVQRIARLAEELGSIVGADAVLARRAAVLAKADLTTEIVGEFPELQGAMGRKYALLQGEHPSVAAAIEEHYKPQGPSDSVPTDPVSIAVALADKLDTLVGFWAIDEKPTGSKDPYALRRAALGVIRIVVENGVRLDLLNILRVAHDSYIKALQAQKRLFIRTENGIFRRHDLLGIMQPAGENGYWWIFRGQVFPTQSTAETLREAEQYREGELEFYAPLDKIAADLLSFFHDRLKVYLRDKGARHDLIDAVLAGSSVISPLAGEMPGSVSKGPALGGGSASLSSPVSPPLTPPRKGEGDGSAVAISPLAGEMSAEPTEGGAVPQSYQPYDVESGHSTVPPSALPGISPAGGEISQPPASLPAGGTNDDLLAIVRKVEALGAFLDTDNGKNLLAGTKRAANILAAEEKKGTRVAEAVDAAILVEPAERALFTAVNQAESLAAQAIGKEDFSGAMLALSALREPVDSFFEAVHVNDEDAAIRANRLALLARIRAATGQVADFSKISG